MELTLSSKDKGLQPLLIVSKNPDDKKKATLYLSERLLECAKLYSLQLDIESAGLLANWLIEIHYGETLEFLTRVLLHPPATKEKVWKINPDTLNEWIELQKSRDAYKRVWDGTQAKISEPPMEIMPLAPDTEEMINDYIANLQKQMLSENKTSRFDRKFNPEEQKVKQLEAEYFLYANDNKGNPLPDRLSFSEWLQTQSK